MIAIDYLTPETNNGIQGLPGSIYDAGLSVGQVKEVQTSNVTIITIPNGQAVFSYQSASLYLNGLTINGLTDATEGSDIEIAGSLNQFDLLLNNSQNTTIEILGNDNNITLNKGRINLIITGNINRVNIINGTIMKKNVSGIQNNVTYN